MRKLFTLLVAVLLTASVFAQSPEKMSYQAVIRDASDNLVTEQEIGMQISILQGTVDGIVVYSEIQTPTTNINGLVSIEIGGESGFETIDWTDGPYFIKTETDPDGGTDYTITGTNQLMSVPYAMHSKTADSVIGEITETDPVFTAWDKSTGISITESQITDLGAYIETETDPSVPTGTATGEMQYWNGTAWVTVQPGNSGEILLFINGKPTWGIQGMQDGDIYNSTTGKVWMDRNLGASQVATSSTDADSYGDLYQWGRAADGHQIRTSGTTSALSDSDTPGHGDFILTPDSPYDWRSPQNDNLWQGVSGINNPCPSGYRLPTEAEWDEERQSWTSNDAAGAFASPLKLPVAGYRHYSSGSLSFVGSNGRYWSSTVVGASARYLYFVSSNASLSSNYRASGLSVRCIKESDTPTTLNLHVSPAGSGEVSGAGNYEVGEVIPITATANTGYTFVNWTGDTDYIANATAESTTVTMPGYDISITANFEEEQESPDWDIDTETEVVEATNPETGKTWMDRNLGASRAATSSTDAEAYGDLYQWGRAADGHKSRTSGTTSTLATSDTPGHGNFITNSSSPYDWRNPQKDNLWQGTGGINNPCPSGYRLPTEAEWEAERASWSSNNAAGAFASPLKLPVAGDRSRSDGSLRNVGSHGDYWSSTVDGTFASALYFRSDDAYAYSFARANGFSVRCLKD